MVEHPSPLNWYRARLEHANICHDSNGASMRHSTRTGSIQSFTLGPIDAAECFAKHATFSKARHRILQQSIGNLEPHFVAMLSLFTFASTHFSVGGFHRHLL